MASTTDRAPEPAPTVPGRAPAPRRTVSGKLFTAGFVLVSAAIVAFILLLSPVLQESVEQQLGGFVEPEPLALGTFGDVAWEVSAEQRGEDACVVATLDGEAAADTCLDAGEGLLGATDVADAGERWLFVMVGAPDLQQVRLELSDGQVLVPRVYRPRGYAATFAFTTLDPGVAVDRAEALDLDERVVEVRTCAGGPLAEASGTGTACTTSRG